MAEQDTLQRLKENLKCTICLDTYTDTKALLCNHAYCKECIERLVIRDSHSVTCPNCRRVTPIPENGVSGLQPAFQINSILDSLVEGVNRPVSYCHEHKHEELKLFCKTCDQLICYKCVLNNARHHKCQYEVLCEQYKREIATSLEPIMINLTTIKKAIGNLEIRCAEISNQRAVAITSIEESIKQFHEALELRQKMLVSQVQQVADKKLDRLASQMGCIKAIQKNFEVCQASVEEKLEKSPEEELAAVKIVALEEIEETNSLFEPDILKPCTEADIEFIGPADIICNYGSLSALELLPNPTQCTATGPGLESAVVEETTRVTVRAVNYLDDLCEIPVWSPHCELVSEITNKRILLNFSVNVDELLITYTPDTLMKGRNQLHIKIRGQHIKGSPFTVRITSWSIGAQISAIEVNRPWGVTVNSRNEVIVSEHKNHCVSVFHSNGDRVRSFGIRGSKEGQFNHPRGIAVDNEDNILVTDYKNNRIQKFTMDGIFLAAVGTKGSGRLQFNGPKGIAFNSINQKLYVVDENCRVQILDLNLNFVGVFGEYGIKKGQLNDPWGIQCDRFGMVYVPHHFRNCIQVFSADGVFLRVIQKFSFGSFPFSLAIDSADTLFVSDIAYHGISLFTLDGMSYGWFGGSQRSQLNHPRGIAFGDCDVLYVCNTNNDCITIF